MSGGHVYAGLGRAAGTDPFGVWDELTCDEVRACQRARAFVDEEALPVLACLTEGEELPSSLLQQLEDLALDTACGSSPMVIGLVALELCRGDARLWSVEAPRIAGSAATTAWEALGHATAACEIAEQYSVLQAASGRPRVAMPQVQEDLVRMADDVGAMQLVCLRLGRLACEGRDTATIRASAARHNSWTALGVVELARELLGADADVPDLHVTRHLQALRHGGHLAGVPA